MNIQDHALILFQGDSITDCGRNREIYGSMGDGYAAMTAGAMTALFPERDLRFLNRGVSGNKVTDLEARWRKDTLELKPDVLTLLIGINDTHVACAEPEHAQSIEEFGVSLRGILTAARAQKPDLALVLLEPFLLHSDNENAQWSADWDNNLAERTAVYTQAARAFDAEYIPLQSVFLSKLRERPPEYFSEDSVHPTMAGHRVIAAELLRCLAAACG